MGTKRGWGRGVREDSLHPARVSPMLWAGRSWGRAVRCFPFGSRWASKSLTPLDRGWTRSSSRNQGPQGDILGPGDMGERAEGERFPRR